MSLSFPHREAGARSFRFLRLLTPTSFTLTPGPPDDQGGGTPLYLGADLLSNTDVRTENRPRFHAKFAKKGLATKVHFPSGFRFQGLKVPLSNNSLWFYNIHGLFTVALQLFNKADQLAVMENLQDVWKRQINDVPLRRNYSLTQQTPQGGGGGEAGGGEAGGGEPGGGESGGGEPRGGEPGGGEPGEAGDVSSDHDYCSSPSLRLKEAVREKLHFLEERVTGAPPSGPPPDLPSVLLLLDVVGQLLSGPVEEGAVTEAVLVLLGVRPWGGVYGGPLLPSVGRWLGQQFQGGLSSISERVENFKEQHIERISDLPPAEQLVTQLFPEAMQLLLLHWMGLSDPPNLDRRRSEFPLLLLILEFTNRNLITGVAHVLYSSLIHK